MNNITLAQSFFETMPNIQADDFLGRLKTTTANGDDDGDGGGRLMATAIDPPRPGPTETMTVAAGYD